MQILGKKTIKKAAPALLLELGWCHPVDILEYFRFLRFAEIATGAAGEAGEENFPC